MKKIVLILVILLMVLFLLIPFSCILRGGKLMTLPFRPFLPVCNLPTCDGGKECSECEGECLAENMNSSVGRCSEWSIVIGCYYVFDKGRVDMICYD
jgi:hypothetical protein